MEAENAQQALALLRRETFDCVLLDYQVPGLNTLELLGKIGRHMAVVTSPAART